MARVNRHGLSDDIPSAVRRQVRKNSRFGCVICRRGFYQYEHIDPTFEEATAHRAEDICCLCGACHDSVTRGHLSKAFVRQRYLEIQAQGEGASPPIGPLDFHDGTAELAIGRLLYAPSVRRLFRYHGRDVITIEPGAKGQLGRMSALFTDPAGNPCLMLEDNAFIGPTSAWDIEVEGPRVTVRRRLGEIVLALRLEPPGRIVVERLDMRFGDCHLIANEDTYTVGRYVGPDTCIWVHADIDIKRSAPHGIAIEAATPAELRIRDLISRNMGQSLAAEDRSIVAHSNAGVMFVDVGLVIASFAGSFTLAKISKSAPLAVDAVRRVAAREPTALPRFLATGSTAPIAGEPH